MDGYPRTVSQARTFDEILHERNLELTGVMHFLIDEAEVVRRNSARQRADDTEETIRHRMQVFRDTAPELLQHYRQQGLLHEVQAMDTVDNVYQSIIQVLQPAARN